MKKVLLVTAICLVVVLVASVATLANPDWRVILQVTSGGTNNLGNIYVGATSQNTDIKDTADNFFQAPPKPNIQLYEMRNDWIGGSQLKSDMRAPYQNGTKVWSNWYIFQDQLPEATEATLSWEPGADSYALPAGTYTMYVKWAPGATDLDGNPLDDAVKEYDLSTAGSQTFVSVAASVQADIRIVCTVGDGPALYKAENISTTGVATSAINCAPILDELGNAYFGQDSARKINKINLGTDPATKGILTAPASSQGIVKGRMAYYGTYLYGVTDLGYVVKRNKAGSTTGNSVVSAGANIDSTPAVLTDGTVYVGAGNTVKKLSMATATGTVSSTSIDLGGPVGSPSIPGTDLVWVNAGNKVICMNSALNMIRAQFDAGAPVGNPATFQSKTVVTAGNQVITLDSTSLNDNTKVVRTVDGTITGSPFVAPDGTIIFMTSAHKLYTGNIYSSAAFAAPKQFAGAGAVKGSPVVGAKYTAVAGGDDYTVYLMDNTTGALSTLAVNQATLGCVSDIDGHIYFTSTDGNLYVIE